MIRVPVILCACALAAFAVGCGNSGRVSSGARVTVYVGASLCSAAQRQLRSAGGAAGDVEVRAVCVPAVVRGGRLDLATVGADARRATEDSATVAFVEAGGSANRFSRPIVEAAGIAWDAASSGAVAMRRILHAVAAGGTGALRESVRDALQ